MSKADDRLERLDERRSSTVAEALQEATSGRPLVEIFERIYNSGFSFGLFCGADIGAPSPSPIVIKTKRELAEYLGVSENQIPDKEPLFAIPVESSDPKEPE